MAVPLTYPGVYIEEVSSGVRTISGVSTSIALFVGWAARGRTDRATRITSYADFEREFGGLDLRSLLGYAVKHFFENGGSDAYVIRIAHTDAVSAEASVGDLDITAVSPGQWASNYDIVVTPRADDASRFRLDVRHKPSANAVVESFENLSLDAADSRFVERIVNDRSAIVTTEVSAASPTALTATTVDLDATTTGADGTELGPDDNDFRTALLGFFARGAIADRIDLFNLVCVPGLTDDTTIGTLQAHCAARRAFLIVDCEEDATVQALSTTALPAGLTGANATNAALYFPWLRAPDPLQSGALRNFPPCGFVAGVYARTDATRGVWKAPAGSEASLTGASGFAVPMSNPENGLLNPRGINCLRTLPVYGNLVWGARTLHGDNDRGSEWKYIPVRRTALFIEESLYRGTQWVVFEPNDETLWAQIRLNVGAFMNNLFRQGAFQGRTPKEAYFVRCDRTTTTQADINLGIVNILVGFAPLKPAEFVVIKLQQMAGEIAT